MDNIASWIKQMISKEASINKKALLNSPWAIQKNKEGKEVIVATADKDSFLSEESKKKLKKK